MPAIIEFDVSRGRVLRFPPIEWAMALRLAHDFGWNPRGANAIDANGVGVGRDNWYGLRHQPHVAYRQIEDADARRLGLALARAASIIARESDAALVADAAGGVRWSAPQHRLCPLQYFVEQGLAAAWIDQLSSDLHAGGTLVVHGSVAGLSRGVLGRVIDLASPTPWNDPADLHLIHDEDEADDGPREHTADDVIARLEADPKLREDVERGLAFTRRGRTPASDIC
jgi:hypothetical protein